MTADRTLGHYRIQESIGKGGMGEVFRATDSRLGRDVALKMLPEALAQQPERLARFQREAQVLAALNHPGIAAIYGLESEDGRHALAMELVPGPDLAERLASGALPTAQVLAIGVQLAEAMEAAHEAGIIHRDLKPANIKLTGDGKVKVLDFGLAKALSDDPSSSGYDPGLSPTLTANMTQGNVILGTAAYMSPEQARGTAVDKRTDIWAFGVVLVELLGGHRLFDGETVSDTLASVLRSEIDLADLPGDVPPAVRRLLRRCLQRDPRTRLRDIGDARIVLQEAIDGVADEAVDGPASLPAGRGPWPLRVALMLALVATAIAGIALMRPGNEVSVPLRKFEIVMDSDDPAVNSAFSPEVSPDGRYLVYRSHDRLWVRDLASLDTRPLPGTEGAREPFWSPDAEWIGFGTPTTMQKVARTGGQPTILANVSGSQNMGSGGSGSWNPDGSILYTTGSTGVLRVSDRAGGVTMHHATQAGEVDFHQINRLPRNRGWVMVVHTERNYGTLGVLTPSGERQDVLSIDNDNFSDPVWSPSGHLVFHRESVAAGIWAVPFSVDNLTVTGEPFLVAAGGTNPSVAADGTLVYTAGSGDRVVEAVWVDRQGNELEAVAELQTGRPFPELSPDGTEFLVAADADAGREVWLFEIPTTTDRQLTFDGKTWGSATWHPDGRQVFAYLEPEYETVLYTIDGSAAPRTLGSGIMARASADGREVFYARPQLDRGFDFDLYVCDLDEGMDSGRELVSTPAIEWSPSPSPDGKYLAYTSDESGRQEVYLTTYPDLSARWQVSRGGGSWARWRGDGQEIYYTTQDAIYAVSVDDQQGVSLGRPRKLFDRLTTNWSPVWADGYAVTSDGERFLLLRNKDTGDEQQLSITVVQNWYAEFAARD
jgi:Tol biopolymer transport system component